MLAALIPPPSISCSRPARSRAGTGWMRPKSGISIAARRWNCAIGKQIYILGPEIDEAQAPQIVVPAGAWQAARSLGDYTLVGCTVAPGFEFEHFEMAPDGFEP